MKGEIADWFWEHYDDETGNVDLDAVWADVRNANHKRAITYLMRNMFGGYCSTGEANWALTSSDGAAGNPWRDGGCESRKPQDMAVTTLNGSLKVTWSPHLYEAGTEVTHYAVQWRTADQDFDASRQTLVLSQTCIGV